MIANRQDVIAPAIAGTTDEYSTDAAIHAKSHTMMHTVITLMIVINFFFDLGTFITAILLSLDPTLKILPR